MKRVLIAICAIGALSLTFNASADLVVDEGVFESPMSSVQFRPAIATLDNKILRGDLVISAVLGNDEDFDIDVGVPGVHVLAAAGTCDTCHIDPADSRKKRYGKPTKSVSLTKVPGRYPVPDI